MKGLGQTEYLHHISQTCNMLSCVHTEAMRPIILFPNWTYNKAVLKTEDQNHFLKPLDCTDLLFNCHSRIFYGYSPSVLYCR